MIVETDRMIADWLNDTTNGANALLPTTPRDGDDGTPEDFVLITDETRDSSVARGATPSQLPGAGVSVDHIVDLDGQIATVTADGRVKVRVRAALANAQTADGVRDMSYYLRTVMRSLRRLLRYENATARTRNDVYLESIITMDLTIDVPKDTAGTGPISGYVLLTLQLRDLAPF